jgi:hypothetical protein
MALAKKLTHENNYNHLQIHVRIQENINNMIKASKLKGLLPAAKVSLFGTLCPFLGHFVRCWDTYDDEGV